MQGLLFQTQSADPGTFIVVAFVLFVVAALAAYVPARRAATVDPISTLKG